MALPPQAGADVQERRYGHPLHTSGLPARDCGVALSDRATALAAVGEPEQAAVAARKALGIAQDSGSGRILSMVAALADSLTPHAHLEPVAQLEAALAQTPGA